MPLLIPFNPEELAKLYTYDYEKLLKQINDAEVNKDTAEELVHCILNLICAYDINHEEKLLLLADTLLHRVEPFTEKKMYLINCSQVKYRLGSLTEDSIYSIKMIKSKNPEILFGKNVLIKNKKAAKKYYKKMPFEAQFRLRTILYIICSSH